MIKYILVVLLIFLASCATELKENESYNNFDDNNYNNTNKNIEVNKMELTSPAFNHESEIPSEYTCDGDDVSPPLNIENVPEGTKSLVLIMDDPDAPVGTWSHWIMFNIPPETTEIEEDSEPEGNKGKNSWSKTGYGGPCPPNGKHRYFFKLYALDIRLSLSGEPMKEEIEEAMKSHIIEEAELIGTYERNEVEDLSDEED